MIRLWARLLLLVVVLAPLTAHAAPSPLDPQLREQAQKAIEAGLKYLSGTQLKDGSWSHSVGITALVVRAYSESEQRGTDDQAFIIRPAQFILHNVQADGSISEGEEHRNYNTATAMFGLAATGDAKYDATIANAQKFLQKLQFDESEGIKRSDARYGGIGYGGNDDVGGGRPDLANLSYALDALKKTGLDPKDPLWAKALVFVDRCQNRSESNDQSFASNDGGFTYMVGYSPYGGTRSYGGMTSAGLISLLFAGVDKTDPRVQAAWKWIGENYTLDENPGTGGPEGMYYYYVAFAKAMAAMGEPEIVDKQGTAHNWRDDLVKKLISVHQSDGSWVNSGSGMWWEGNKDLTTARMIIALNLAMK
jgi:squalene-hopene/tetraprenyl-beta-curcumene cyclase